MAEDNNAIPDIPEAVTSEGQEDLTKEMMAEAAEAELHDVQMEEENQDLEGTDSQEEPEVEKQESRKFFGKKKDKKDEKIEELTDQLKRQMAEFDNFRKRTNQEKASMYIVGAKEIVEKMLPVVDSFERGLAAVPEESQEDPFVDGMNKIYKQLMAALEEAGVAPIEAVGQEFDPELHNAVMHIEDEEAGENIVAEELQKGYLYKDFVVRHSMVKVAN